MNYINRLGDVFRFLMIAFIFYFEAKSGGGTLTYILYATLFVFVIVDPLDKNIKLIVFLIPCLGFSGEAGQGINPITMFLMFVFLKYLIFRAFRNRRYSSTPVIIAFLIVALETINFAVYQQQSFSEYARWVGLFVFAVLLISERGCEIDFDNIYRPFIIGYVVSSLIGLVYYAEAIPASAIQDSSGVIARFSGLAGDPNNFGFYSMLALSFTLYKLQVSRFKLLFIGVISFVVFTGLLTVSRSYVIALVIWGFLYLTFRSDFRRFATLFSFVFISFAIYFAWSLEILAFQNIVSRFSFNDLGGLTGSRSNIFASYIEVFASLNVMQQLFGVGVLNYVDYYFHTPVSDAVFNFGVIVGPHNTIIESFAAFGIMGTILLVIWFVKCFNLKEYPMRLSRRNLFYIFAILSSLLIFSMSLQNLAKYSFYFSLFLIVIFYRELITQKGRGKEC